MIPPKYNFYVGKALSFKFTYGSYIDRITGEYHPNTGITINAMASQVVAIDSTVNSIYVNYNTSTDMFDEFNNVRAEYLGVFMYGKNGFLGRKVVYHAQVVKLLEGTTSIAIEFTAYYNDIMETHKRMAKSSFTDIYALSLVNPHYADISKKFGKESNQEFFRISLDGKIKFFGWDYEYIKATDIEDNLVFVIEKLSTITNQYEAYYIGQFNKTDCKIDHSKKSCEIALTILDQYTKVLNAYDNTYDLIKLAPAISKMTIHKQPIRQIYIKGGKTVTNIFGGTYWETEVNEVIDDQNLLINKYYFAYIDTTTEFRITTLPIEEANGLYGGALGSMEGPNGYTCVREQMINTSTGLPFGWAFYICAPDGTKLYVNVELSDYITDNTSFWPVEGGSDKYRVEYAINNFIYQRLLCDIDQIPEGPATYPLPVDDFVSDNRNYKRCIGQEGGKIVGSIYASTEPTRFGENDEGKYFINTFSPSYYRPIPVCRSGWVNVSLWYIYDLNFDLQVEKLTTSYTLKDSFSLAAVVKALLAKIDPTLRHEATAEYSQFFYGNNLPFAWNKDPRFYVYITQKTNILKGNYDQAAQKAEITFKDLMEMLRDCFKCYWYIEDNKFKIEHITFFLHGGSYSSGSTSQLNFTELIDRLNKKPTAYFQSAVEYNKQELAARYEFEWMDDATENFRGPAIDVKSNYIQKDKTENISINQFSSDLDFMLINPENFSDDGFALLCPIKSGNTLEVPMVKSTLFDEDGFNYSILSSNFYAAWPYLLRYYMWDMPAKNIEINEGLEYSVRAVKKCMTQDIEFPIAEDISTQELITTEFGNGVIDNINISLTTRKAKITLLYTPS